MASLDSILTELRRAAARSRAARYALHGLLGAAAWAAGVLIVERLVAIELGPRLALIGVPVAIVVAFGAWMLRRPTPLILMQLADIRLGLKERLSTAWERKGAAGPLDAAQQRDALHHANSAKLAGAFPIRINRGEASLVAILTIFALALALLPNQVLAQRQADRASQTRAANALKQAERKIAAASTTPTPNPQVDKILRDTQAKIQQAGSPRRALESITPAEQRLQQLTDPRTPGLSSSAQNLANALSNAEAGRAASQAISRSPAQGAQAVRNLASQLQNLTPQQRQDLAKALADAAQHAQDSQMRNSLNQASNSLQSGDTTSTAQSLNDVASQLDQLQQQESTDQAVASAINVLEAARQELATQADRDAGQGGQAGASASASASASGSGNGNGHGSGTGTGNGNGSGNGNGNGTGTGTGSGTGTGGQNPGNGNGSGSGSGSATKTTERIYVPGQPVPGQSQNDPTPLGPGQDVPLSPYTQVIQAYQQAALDAVDQSLIPGSERDLVREYFSQLGEQQP